MNIRKQDLDIFTGLMREIAQEEIKSPFSLGKIDPSYSSGKPKIVFDGESSPSSKEYSYASGYTPKANDRVIVANVGGSHVVLGEVVTDPLINKWQDLSLPSGWTNFGGGYAPAQFMKTSYNTVKLRGLVKLPSTFTSGNIATLPVGARPAYSDIFNGVMKKSDASLGSWQATIGYDGNISSGHYTGAPSGLLWLSLAGIEFDLG
jgi:hypothetical protein